MTGGMRLLRVLSLMSPTESLRYQQREEMVNGLPISENGIAWNTGEWNGS